MSPETEQTSESTPPAAPPEPTFSKAQVEQIVKERLERAQKKAEADQAAAAEAARVKALEEQGEWKTLAEKRAQQLAELETKAQAAATAEASVARYRIALEAYLKSERADMPKPIVALLDKLDPVDQLEWIAANRAELTKPAGGTPQRSVTGRGAPVPAPPDPNRRSTVNF